MDGSALFILIIMAIVVIWIVNSYDSSEEKPKERKNNTMRNLPVLPSSEEDFFSNRWRNLPTSYYPTSPVIMPPDHRAIIAEHEPKRTIEMLEKLAFCKSLENVMGPVALEHKRQGGAETVGWVKEGKRWFGNGKFIKFTIKSR